MHPKSSSTVVNLEHGYFGAMALPVQTAFEEAVRHVNTHLSPFVRGEFTATHVDALRERLARLINAEPHEILLTRSASESMQVLIGQYHQLQPGDVVLWSNLDYPAMRTSMAWLEQRRGVTPQVLQLDLPISQDALLEKYKDAIRHTAGLKLLLLSQVYPCNGQQAPVREIVAFAREHGVDVLVDSAHALGQLPLDVQQLHVDFAGFNLHKWIGAPPGLGFVFIRATQLAKIEPHMGDRNYPLSDIRCRLYVGMPPLAAILATPAALDFHTSLGGSEAKAARLAALREYWVGRVAALPGLRLLSPRAAEHGSALVALAIDGMSARELQQALLNRFNLFTVERNVGAADVVRVTVALTTTTEELDQLVAALTVLTREARVL